MSISSVRWMLLWSGQKMNVEKFSPNVPICTILTSQKYWVQLGKKWLPKRNSPTMKNSQNYQKNIWKNIQIINTSPDRNELVSITERKWEFLNIRCVEGAYLLVPRKWMLSGLQGLIKPFPWWSWNNFRHFVWYSTCVNRVQSWKRHDHPRD